MQIIQVSFFSICNSIYLGILRNTVLEESHQQFLDNQAAGWRKYLINVLEHIQFFGFIIVPVSYHLHAPKVTIHSSCMLRHRVELTIGTRCYTKEWIKTLVTSVWPYHWLSRNGCLHGKMGNEIMHITVQPFHRIIKCMRIRSKHKRFNHTARARGYEIHFL